MNGSTKTWVKTVVSYISSAFLIIVALAGSLKETPSFIKSVYELLPIQILIILLSISLLISAYYFFSKNNTKEWLVKRFIDKRIRIAILLPLNHDNDFVREDAELQLQGFGNALPESREKLNSFDLKFLDHKSNANIAKDLIIEELKSGTKYFLNTMSSVSIELTKEFPELDKKYGNGEAILVCTVAGSNEITTSKNKIYRFYINLEDEIQTLIDNIDDSKNKASVIYFNSSPYAENCANSFIKLWNEKKGRAHNISKDHNTIELKVNRRSQIDNKIRSKRRIVEDRDVIFIVGYGQTYLDILESLKDINGKALIVTTSTFSFKMWEDKVTDILNGFNWLSCKPSLKDDEYFKDDTDVVTYFSMNTLERFMEVVLNTKQTMQSDFHTVWSKSTIPSKLCYEAIKEKDGDYKIILAPKWHLIDQQSKNDPTIVLTPKGNIVN